MNTYDSCSMQTKGPSHKNYGVLRNKISTELKSKEWIRIKLKLPNWKLPVKKKN